MLFGGIYTGIILGTLGVIFGFVARANGKKDGKSLTGIITGFIAIGLSVLLLFAAIGETFEYDYYDDDYYYDDYDRGEYDEDDFDRYFDERLEDYRNGNL